MINRILLIGFGFMLFGCGNNNEEADAYGNFTATEIIISSETAGKILSMPHTEGQEIKAGEVAAIVDTMQAYLMVKELYAKKVAAKAKIANISAQAAVYQQQKEVAKKELARFQKMLKDGAATQKQVDDIQGQIDIVFAQVQAVESNVAAVKAEISAIEAGIAQSIDMLNKSEIKFPASGTVLNKYVQPGELVRPGKAICKIALLESMELKAYISGNQLSALKLGQEVEVSIDKADGKLINYPGTISWISQEAEFTPKNIQTREERLSQVYAIKVLVKNDGAIKINMPGEVRF